MAEAPTVTIDQLGQLAAISTGSRSSNDFDVLLSSANPDGSQESLTVDLSKPSNSPAPASAEMLALGRRVPADIDFKRCVNAFFPIFAGRPTPILNLE